MLSVESVSSFFSLTPKRTSESSFIASLWSISLAVFSTPSARLILSSASILFSRLSLARISCVIS